MGRTAHTRLTFDEMRNEIHLLQRIADGNYIPRDPHEMKPIWPFIARRLIGIAVTQNGTLKITLTKLGKTALESGKALLDHLGSTS